MLVADDVLMNREVVSGLLQELLGCTTFEVADGKEAVAAVRDARQRGEPFDACFMDVQMPEMDGLEAAAAHQRDAVHWRGCSPRVLTVIRDHERMAFRRGEGCR